MRSVKTRLINVALATAFAATAALFPSGAFGQDALTELDPETVPPTADSLQGFIPQGWKLEEDVVGDVNQDGVEDHLLKLVESPRPNAGEGEFVEANRALVIVFASNDGSLRRAAVATKLLQCTSCGGAFYGAGNAPANVSVKNGVIIVSQDYGSRWVTDMTFRFRYDEQPGMFILIGFDFASRDRAEGDSTTESTNYLTGKRITTRTKAGKKGVSRTTTVAKDRMSIEEVDKDKFDEDANKRLGL